MKKTKKEVVKKDVIEIYIKTTIGENDSADVELRSTDGTSVDELSLILANVLQSLNKEEYDDFTSKDNKSKKRNKTRNSK